MAPLFVRLNGFDADMVNYSHYIQVPLLSLFDEIRYLKEPAFWFSIVAFNKISPSVLLTFIVYDYIFLIIMLYALRCINNSYFCILFMLLFFPFFLGFQNIYRQFLGGALFILSLSMLSPGKSKSGSLVLVCLSIMFHNVYGLLIPAYVVLRYRRYGIGLGVILALCITVIIFLLPVRHHENTGLRLELIYGFGVFILCGVFYIYRRLLPRNMVMAIIITFAVYLVFYLRFESLYVERFGLAIYMVFFPFICTLLISADDYLGKLLRIGVGLAFILPIFIFPSARELLN